MTHDDTTPLNELTPERAAEVAGKLADHWKQDWELLLTDLSQRINLSMRDTMLFYLINMVNIIGIRLTEQQPVGFHENCTACRDSREFHETQWEFMKLSLRAMKEEHEDWKDEPDHDD